MLGTNNKWYSNLNTEGLPIPVSILSGLSSQRQELLKNFNSLDINAKVAQLDFLEKSYQKYRLLLAQRIQSKLKRFLKEDTLSEEDFCNLVDLTTSNFWSYRNNPNRGKITADSETLYYNLFSDKLRDVGTILDLVNKEELEKEGVVFDETDKGLIGIKYDNPFVVGLDEYSRIEISKGYISNIDLKLIFECDVEELSGEYKNIWEIIIQYSMILKDLITRKLSQLFDYKKIHNPLIDSGNQNFNFQEIACELLAKNGKSKYNTVLICELERDIYWDDHISQGNTDFPTQGPSLRRARENKLQDVRNNVEMLLYGNIQYGYGAEKSRWNGNKCSIEIFPGYELQVSVSESGALDSTSVYMNFYLSKIIEGVDDKK